MNGELKETYVLRDATLGDDTTIHLFELHDSYNIDGYYAFYVSAYVPATGQTYASSPEHNNAAYVTWDNSWPTEPGIQLSESSYTLTGYIPESEDDGYTLNEILICDDTGDFDYLSYANISEFNSALADGIPLTTVGGKTNVHVTVSLYNSVDSALSKTYISNTILEAELDYCYNCGTQYPVDELIYDEGTHYYYCNNCVPTQCMGCGNEYPISDLYYYNDGMYLCDNCIDSYDDTATCSTCGMESGLVGEDIYYDSSTGKYWCYSCYDDYMGSWPL
jgi:hypothetical protein